MCERASFIPTADNQLLWLLRSDNHKDIAKEYGLRDDDLFIRRWVKIEAKPKGDPFSTIPEDWEVIEDEHSTLPTWYEAEREAWHERVLKELCEVRIPREMREGVVASLNICHGTWCWPWIREVGNVIVCRGVTIGLPVATKTGDVWAEEDATISFPAVIEAGDIVICRGAIIKMPAIAETGNVWCDKGTTIVLLKTTKTGRIRGSGCVTRV